MMKNQLPDHERALWILKKQGPKSVKALAGEMNITTEGVRFHLMKLEKEGLISSESVAEGRGRPKKYWSLTEKGHNRFPDRHGELTANLLAMMRDELGERAVDQVIGKHEEVMLARYAEEINADMSLEERIAKLTEIRTREGYMAGYEKRGDEFLFVENHCPICSAAAVCQGFCRAEMSIFKRVLGEKTEIERVEHIVSGERRCAYKIS